MTQHVPVLGQEILDGLALKPGATVVDGTLGGGGHTAMLLEPVGPGGRVIAVDRDPLAVQAAQERFAGRPVELVVANFCRLPDVLHDLHVEAVDGVLLDLGLSSDQLADVTRGFSFDSDGELDLRFSTEDGEAAWQLLAHVPEKQLADLIYEFGEERASRKIARAIVETRRQQPIRTARQLAALVRRCVRRTPGMKIDPATRTFQALRIAVNSELESLELVLQRIPLVLRPGGRAAIISFHSLEDRRVKNAFRSDPRYAILTKKPIRPNEAELRRNVRSRSAKLRIAERTASGNVLQEPHGGG
jgi:16S rRNA (cytosine1402-N4)-methyltransferase